MILEDVMKALDCGHFPVLLTERCDHLEYFYEILNGRIDNLIVFKGGMGKKQLAAVKEKLSDTKAIEQKKDAIKLHLQQCLETNQKGQIELKLKLPSSSALDSIVAALAKLIG